MPAGEGRGRHLLSSPVLSPGVSPTPPRFPWCEFGSEATSADQAGAIFRLTEFDHGIPVLAHMPTAIGGGSYQLETILHTECQGKATNDDEPFDSHSQMNRCQHLTERESNLANQARRPRVPRSECGDDVGIGQCVQ